MKLNVIKSIIAIALALLIGIITYSIAPEIDHRKWIAFGVTAITTAISLVLAMGINYNCGYRTANIKVVTILGALVVLVGNIAFSCFTYNILIYIAVIGIITLLFSLLIYNLIPKSDETKSEQNRIHNC